MGLGGSADIQSGWTYFGSFAVWVCRGPVKKLNKVTNGDTIIYQGPLDVSSADGDGKSSLVTEIGGIDFYWGLSTQNVSPLLDSLEIDFGAGPVSVPMPNFKRICYAVCQDVAFGTQVVPPTLKFDVEVDSSALAISAHSISEDAVIPEAVYDYLVDKFAGAGIAAANIDSASFIAAAETTIDEGLGASPNLDSVESIRETVGRMLSYIDGRLYFHHGKLKLLLIRAEDTSSLVSVDESDLIEEPKPGNQQFGPTWNVTYVSFTDRDNKWEGAIEPYTDDANAAIQQRAVLKEFNFPWLTRRDAAKSLAKLLGIKGGVPSMFWSLHVKPAFKSVIVGQLLKLSYAKFGLQNEIVRVQRIRRGGPLDPKIELEVQVEQTRDTTHDYTPGADTFGVPGTIDATGTDTFAVADATPRLSILPDELKGTQVDGFLVAIDRPTDNTIRADVWWSPNPGVIGYKIVQIYNAFPATGTIVSWHRIRTSHWNIRVEMASQDNLDRLQSLHDESVDLYLVVGQRLWKTVGTVKDQHQVLSPWLQRVDEGRFEIVESLIIDLEVEGGFFATDDLLLETLGSDGKYPALNAYFGRVSDFAIYQSGHLYFERVGQNYLNDVAFVRGIKVTTSNHKNAQGIGDVDAVTYDRDLTTMCADGTYSRDWGVVARSTYEFYDTEGGTITLTASSAEYLKIDDLDTALGAIYGGTATADQTLMAEHIDDVLGAMISDNHQYYNT